MSAGSDRRNITDLRLKLEFLVSEEARLIHGHGSQKQLAGAADINESTFKTLKTPGNKDRISAGQERGLAYACRFRIDWPEWHTGTAKDFQARYLKDVKPRGKQHSQDRRTDTPLTARYGEQETKDGRLASMKMRVLSNSGLEWRVWTDLICRAVDGYGIRRGFVAVACGEARADREEANFKQVSALDGANATLRLAAGTDRKQVWEVRALGGVLDEDLCPREHYCIVRELAHGNDVKVTFSVYVKDVPPTDPYLCKNDGEPLAGTNRKLILDRIAALDLLGGKGDSGEVVICSHEVIFEGPIAALGMVETSGESDGE